MSRQIDRMIHNQHFETKAGDDTIICRCEEITQGEIRKAVHEGMFTLTEIRRFLRVGMGLCQGQTCGRLVKGIVARELKISPYDLEGSACRAPMRPIEMRILGNEARGSEE